MIQIPAGSIGADALELLGTGQQALVNGMTSRGIFLLTQDQKVIFISSEGWRGPWTVNLAENKGLNKPENLKNGTGGDYFPLNRVSIGSRVLLAHGKICFSAEEIEISCEHLGGWQDLPVPVGVLNWSETEIRLDQVARRIIRKGSYTGWISLLQERVSSTLEKTEIAGELVEVCDALQRLTATTKDPYGVFPEEMFRRILGRGTGLTPSGDDVVVGMLLALRRAVFLQAPGHFMDRYQPIEELSRQMTTSLSTCLITSAIKGQADERLISALDGILWGTLDADECAARLLAYGSSSGGDSLLGMYTVLKA